MGAIAVVLAGGTGTRMGLAGPKQLAEVGGRTILGRSIEAFDTAPGIDHILVVMATGHLPDAERVAKPYAKVAAVIEGGTTRTESTLRALAALTGATNADVAEATARQPDDGASGARARRSAGGAVGAGGVVGAGGAVNARTKVLFHDAARPFVAASTIAACLTALDDADAVAVAVASSDTVVVVDGDRVTEMPSRERLRRFQTPQGFRLGTLLRAYEVAGPNATATDDCGIVHQALPDVPIVIAPGTEDNIKVTHPGDLAIAAQIAARHDAR